MRTVEEFNTAAYVDRAAAQAAVGVLLLGVEQLADREYFSIRFGKE